MTENIFAIVLIVALGAISLYFAWRQFQTLEWLKAQNQMPPEDRQYYRRQIIRRLLGCALTLALAGLLIGFVFAVLPGIDELAARGDQAKRDGRQATDDEIEVARFGMTYVAVIMIVLLVLLVVVFLDVVAIRRFGMRHRKRIRDDRRAMLMRQLPLLRRDREERE